MGETVVVVDLQPKESFKSFTKYFYQYFPLKYYLEEISLDKVYEDIPLVDGCSRHYYLLKEHPPSREDVMTKVIEEELGKERSSREIASKLIKEKV